MVVNSVDLRGDSTMGVKLTYDVVIVSGIVKRISSHICTHVYIYVYIHNIILFLRFFSKMGYFRVLSRIQCVIDQVLISYLFYI